jgi:hypothetical protein
VKWTLGRSLSSPTPLIAELAIPKLMIWWEQATECAQPHPQFTNLQVMLIPLPRGFMHDATATDRSSLHLTVGIHSVTWASVVLGAVQGVVEREASFRESLPPALSRMKMLN